MADHDTIGRQAANELRSLLRAAGADAELIRRVNSWENLHGGPHVYVPPLPAEVVERLVAPHRAASS